MTWPKCAFWCLLHDQVTLGHWSSGCDIPHAWQTHPQARGRAGQGLECPVVAGYPWECGNDHYIQKQGTAMGTEMAPSYANIFMGDIEDEIVDKGVKKSLWVQFLNDIILIWTDAMTELDNFISGKFNLPINILYINF